MGKIKIQGFYSENDRREKRKKRRTPLSAQRKGKVRAAFKKSGTTQEL